MRRSSLSELPPQSPGTGKPLKFRELNPRARRSWYMIPEPVMDTPGTLRIGLAYDGFIVHQILTPLSPAAMRSYIARSFRQLRLVQRRAKEIRDGA